MTKRMRGNPSSDHTQCLREAVEDCLKTKLQIPSNMSGFVHLGKNIYIGCRTLWRPLSSHLQIRDIQCDDLANAIAVHVADNSWPVTVLNEVLQSSAAIRARQLQAHGSRIIDEMQRKQIARVQDTLHSSLPRLRDACGDDALAYMILSSALRLTKLVNLQQLLRHGSVEEMAVVVAALLSTAWKQNACADDDACVDHGDTPRPSRRNTIVRMMTGVRDTAAVNSVEAKLMTSIAFGGALL